MIAMHQVVRAIRDVPEQGVVKGMVGTVITIFEPPEHAYEVEFADAEGRTALQATLVETDLEVVEWLNSSFLKQHFGMEVLQKSNSGSG